MGNSATPRRGRAATTQRITEAAQELAITRGFDGFTMDDLADAAEVSRRTLFNHHASKEEAVLGVPPEISPETMAEFAAGGPTGDLVADLTHLVTAMSTPDANHGVEACWDTDRLCRIRAVLERNPQLLLRAEARFEELADRVAPMLATRLGCPDSDPRVETLYRTSVAVLHVAFEEFTRTQGTTTVSQLFQERLDLLREVLLT